MEAQESNVSMDCKYKYPVCLCLIDKGQSRLGVLMWEQDFMRDHAIKLDYMMIQSRHENTCPSKLTHWGQCLPLTGHR